MSKDFEKLLVIHIPRNGSYCIPWKNFPGFDLKPKPVGENLTIKNARLYKEPKEGLFDTFLELKTSLNIPEFNVITIVRNPFTRAYSLYVRYLQLCNLLVEDKSFKTFLTMIKNGMPCNPITRNMLGKTQSSYLKNENGEIDQSIVIFKFEEINSLKQYLDNTELFVSFKSRADNEEELNKIINITSLDNIDNTIPNRISKEKWRQEVKLYQDAKLIYTIDQLKQDYDLQCVEMVKEIFSEDFDNFNYSRNLEDII